MPAACAHLKQWHYCGEPRDVDALFERKEEVVLLIFDKLLLALESWPDVAFSAAKRAIVFVSSQTFLVVNPMKKALDMHFSLPEPHEDPPVYKVAPYNGRFVHYIRLYGEADLDASVLKLIRKAYAPKG